MQQQSENRDQQIKSLNTYINNSAIEEPYKVELQRRKDEFVGIGAKDMEEESKSLEAINKSLEGLVRGFVKGQNATKPALPPAPTAASNAAAAAAAVAAALTQSSAGNPTENVDALRQLVTDQAAAMTDQASRIEKMEKALFDERMRSAQDRHDAVMMRQRVEELETKSKGRCLDV